MYIWLIFSHEKNHMDHSKENSQINKEQDGVVTVEKCSPHGSDGFCFSLANIIQNIGCEGGMSTLTTASSYAVCRNTSIIDSDYHSL